MASQIDRTFNTKGKICVITLETGTLMGAPLRNLKNNAMHLKIELPRKEEHKLSALMALFKEKKGSFKAKVGYY
jgi:hypothetical protein